MRFGILLITLLGILLVSPMVVADAPDTDISGTWIISTPECDSLILSIPDHESGEGYNFIMLLPGDMETDFGYSIGEYFANLQPFSETCWRATEKFRFPESYGGGSFWDITHYCIDQDDQDILRFHTDNPSVVFPDYPLYREAEGFDAIGVWQSTELEDFSYSMVVVPLADGGWEAWFLDGYGGLLDEIDTPAGTVIYTGDEPPGDEWIEGSAISWVTIGEEEEFWFPMSVMLDSIDSLVISFDQGPEFGTIETWFERVY